MSPNDDLFEILIKKVDDIKEGQIRLHGTVEALDQKLTLSLQIKDKEIESVADKVVGVEDNVTKLDVRLADVEKTQLRAHVASSGLGATVGFLLTMAWKKLGGS